MVSAKPLSKKLVLETKEFFCAEFKINDIFHHIQ